MECKYCKEVHEAIKPTILTGDEYNNFQENSLELSKSNSTITAYIQDDLGGWCHDKFKINYCPMCGKKMEAKQ